jgi:hypothetical protein
MDRKSACVLSFACCMVMLHVCMIDLGVRGICKLFYGLFAGLDIHWFKVIWNLLILRYFVVYTFVILNIPRSQLLFISSFQRNEFSAASVVLESGRSIPALE